MKVRMLTPWIGEPPEYLHLFRERIEASAPLVEWLFLPLDWATLRRRVHAATGALPPPNASPRKVCDFRPAFGEIFRDEIGDADWWGWCDLDCIFGDLPAFLTPERLEYYDLITDNPQVVNGPFAILRNDERMRTLYRSWPGMPVAFKAKRMTGHELWFTGVVRAHREIFAVADHVAWDENDFTEIVRGAAVRKAQNGIRPLFLANVHDSDREIPLPQLKDGKLIDFRGRELMTYHCVVAKRFPSDFPYRREPKVVAPDRRAFFEAMWPKGGICVEVGSQRGRSAADIVAACEPLALFLVDAWRYIDSRDYDRDPANRVTAIREDEMQECAATVGKEPSVAMLRMMSADAARLFADGSLDAVYVDSDHTEPGVRADIASWWPKVKSGGVFSGHDYCVGSYGWIDVRKVVDEILVDGMGLELMLSGEEEWRSWAVRKP